MPIFRSESVLHGIFCDKLPLVSDFLLGYLRETAIDGLDEILFLAPLGFLESSLDYKVAEAVTYESA